MVYSQRYNIISSYIAVVLDASLILVFTDQFQLVFNNLVENPDNFWIFKCEKTSLNIVNSSDTAKKWICLELNYSLLPAIYVIITVLGYYLVNLVVAVKGLKLNGCRICSLIFQNLALFLPGLLTVAKVIHFIGTQSKFDTIWLVLCYVSFPGPILLKLVNFIRRKNGTQDEENESSGFLKIFKRPKQSNSPSSNKQATVSEKIEMVISETYLFQAATIIPLSLLFKIYFLTSLTISINSTFELAVIIFGILLNTVQIIHAFFGYYNIRYTKFNKTSKESVLYEPKDSKTELTFLQKYLWLPLDIFFILLDHVGDFLVILMYFKLYSKTSAKNYSSGNATRKYVDTSDESVFSLSLAIISIVIWVVSNVCLMWITNKRYQDLYQEDEESFIFGSMKLNIFSNEKSKGLKTPKVRIKYILVSLIFGPILNAINIYKTKPRGALIDYKFALMKQVNTLDTVLEDFPQLLVHFYVLFVLSGKGSNSSFLNLSSLKEEFNKKDFSFFDLFFISPKNLLQIKLVFALFMIALKFSAYKRTTLEIKCDQDVKPGAKNSLKRKAAELSDICICSNVFKSYSKENFRFELRSFSQVMMLTSQYNDTIAQMIFLLFRSLFFVLGFTKDLDFMIKFITAGVLKTVGFQILYSIGKLSRGKVCDKLCCLKPLFYIPKRINEKVTGYVRVPDFTQGDKERTVSSLLWSVSYLTYNLGSNYLVTLLNYSLTMLEVYWFSTQFVNYFGINPILILFVSWCFATMSFILYKTAVVFDGKSSVDKMLKDD